MEIKKEVKVYLVEYKCPSCENGHLLPTGNVLMTYPAKYPHKCTECEYTETFFVQYPKIQYDNE